MTKHGLPLLTVVTFNVSMDLVGHPMVPEWDRRKRACLDALRNANADAIGLQETSPAQLTFLATGLAGFDVWTHRVQLPADFLVDVRARFGREFPAEFAEVALLTRRETLAVEAHDHWWLSPTPQREFSAGFGNLTPRLAVRARAVHRATGAFLTLATTHIDHRAPLPMTEMLSRRLAPDVDDDRSVIVFGDLNTHPDGRGYELMLANGWRDAYGSASSRSDAKEIPTFIDDGGTWARRRIDHVLYRSSRLRAIEWSTLAPPPGRLSDHAPVLVRFEVTSTGPRGRAGSRTELQRPG